jgi:hypothetical protein
MENVLMAFAFAIFLPGVLALGAFGFYTLQYARLRLGRKNTLVDYLHDFAGSWTRLIARTDRPEELRYLKKMLFSGAFFFAYTSLLMAVGGNRGA